MKKVLSLFLAVTVIVTAFSALPVFAASFPDMPEGHWAYSAVMRLYEDGTVNGMPDGSFNPTGTVSRAEFVKMLGKSSQKAQAEFKDVTSEHWAYDYIMYSGLEGDENGNFNPTTPITRAEVANLLYKRFGGGATAKAPYYISSQGTDLNATAWVYNTGLILGADKLNLRLADSLTRAEAASLIVRAKDLDPSKMNNFIDNFSDETYKNIYNGLNLFDSEYNKDAGITYEELSAASLRYQYKQRNPAISYVYEKKYEGKYAHFWNIMCRNPLDAKGYGSTEAEGKKLVTLEDAIAIITYGARRNEYIKSAFVNVDGKTYSGVNTTDGTQFEDVMSYAYNYGISLYADKSVNMQKTATMKEIACIYMQYGLTFGDHILLRCGYNSEYLPTTVRRDKSTHPDNADFYRYILEEIPNKVYETEYKLGGELLYSPKDFEGFAFLHAHMFYTPLMYIASEAYEKGADIYIDYHPSLLLSVKNVGEIYRVRIDVRKAFDGMKLSDIIPLGEGVKDRTVKEGESFWCDVATNEVRMSTYINYQLFTIEQVIE